jgi:putative membrane protein
MMWHRSWGAGDWLVLSLMMLIFWGVLVAGAVWLVRNARRPLEHSTTGARQILDEKLARGEVTEDEYLRRRDLLTR